MSRGCRSVLLAFVLCVALPAEQRPPVIDAVRTGHAVGHEQDGVAAVRRAIAAGANVNAPDSSGWTPLMYAALECRPAIIRLLLEIGASTTARAATARATSFIDHGQTALIIAGGCFIARVRAELAPARGYPASYVQSELSAAEIMVRDLIAHGADVNAADADGRTPLMMAAMQGWPGAISELLAHGAEPNMRDSEGRIAIDYADSSATDIVKLLNQAHSLPPTGHSGRTVCDAELALYRRGFDMPIDCIAGQQLHGAIQKFQVESGLPSTGELDPPTKLRLGIR